MVWTAKTTATQLVNITTEQFFTAFSANPRELVQCQIEVNFPATPTDDAIVAVYATLDDTAENWDDSPIMEFTLGNGTDPHAISFSLVGSYKYRIGVRRSGTTDTLTSADLSWRKDGVSV